MSEDSEAVSGVCTFSKSKGSVVAGMKSHMQHSILSVRSCHVAIHEAVPPVARQKAPSNLGAFGMVVIKLNQNFLSIAIVISALNFMERDK